MDSSILELIVNQTGIKDEDLIKKTYDESKEDIVSTICTLLAVPKSTRKRKRNEVSEHFDELRKICDEKDEIYQELMKKNE